MAFGVKMKAVKTKKAYTISSLYEVIKDKEFSAGKPELVNNGFSQVIAFPQLDRQNQVQIMKSGLAGSDDKETQKFQVIKTESADINTRLGNSVISHATGGLSSLKQMAGKNAKLCEQLVDATAKELGALDL